MNEHKHILILDEYQKRINLENNNLLVSGEESEPKVFPLSELEAVLVTKNGGSISFAALNSLIQQGIGFTFLDYKNHDLASINPKRKQALLLSKKAHHWHTTGQAQALALKVIQDKVRQQRQVIYELKRRKYFKSLKPRIKQRISLAHTQLSKLAIYLNHLNVASDQAHKTLFTLEAKAAKYYWRAIGLYLPKDYGFTGRQKHGDTPDAFNAALNYAYAILAARITQQLCALGFDPSLGFLHADQVGRSSLTYDIIERYRQRHVDMPILRYAMSREPWRLDRRGRLCRESKKAVTWHILEALDPRTPDGIQLITRDLRCLRVAVLNDHAWQTEP